MAQGWKVTVDRDRCIGSGSCVFTAPHAFDMDDACKAMVLDPIPAGDEAVRAAVESCPTSALAIHEATA